MGHLKNLRIVLGIFKDKASLIKTTLSTKRRTSSIHRAIVRATTHGVSSPSPDKRIVSVLSLGHGTRHKAGACIGALMERLHGTHNAFVALKCLFIVHNIISRGSFILKDQLSIYPSSGGRNFLNLSMFRDNSDPETWELSSWVRWYADVLEQNLTVSRVLGYYLSSSKGKKKDNDKEDKVLALLNSDLLREMDVLVGFVEEICNAPSSLHLQTKNLVYEIVRLVSEDYRFIQREIFIRIVELGDRMTSLSVGGLTQFLTAMKRFEDCKERLSLLFVNRKKNDALWDLVNETKTNIQAAVNKKLQEKTVVNIRKRDELIRFASADGWLGLDRVSLAVATVR
ncbi:hypothetical protein ACOSP7_010214 [Xanthoceras sorbifolium]|uniref:ENTH domain-containing protein n=1 Tax=Xanthoceras sorbifolium TaxID=99658 RepID=A0ABQ8GXV8_9ROSI|nr:hypothetical protein JRO89_XSUnG0189200 [Xanthoceras sorbifolium]